MGGCHVASVGERFLIVMLHHEKFYTGLYIDEG